NKNPCNTPSTVLFDTSTFHRSALIDLCNLKGFTIYHSSMIICAIQKDRHIRKVFIQCISVRHFFVWPEGLIPTTPNNPLFLRIFFTVLLQPVHQILYRLTSHQIHLLKIFSQQKAVTMSIVKARKYGFAFRVYLFFCDITIKDMFRTSDIDENSILHRKSLLNRER